MKQISWLSGLSATGSPTPARVLADLVLRTIADGERGARQLVLRQREQEVRLILGRIDPAPEPIAEGGLISLDARVVSRCHDVGAEAARVLGEGRELQVAVAVRARQRRPAGCVLLHEVRHDLLVELPLEIDDVVGDVDPGGDAPRVVQIVNRAAAAERRLALALIVELHRQTDDVVALLGEQRRGHRRIDAAGHRHYDSHTPNEANPPRVPTRVAIRVSSSAASRRVRAGARRRDRLRPRSRTARD